MARTLNPVAHSMRRDAFIDAAQELLASRGYEQLSVQDVINTTGASKGAFYHYFGSKADLLEAVVSRMTSTVLSEVEPLIDDPSIPARDKLSGLFARIGSWKTQRKELLLALLESWYSDENVAVRDKFRRTVAAELTPVFARIIAQGNAEGDFNAPSSQHSAEVLVALLMGLNERAGNLFLARQAGEISFHDVESTLSAYVDAFERILGLRPGSLTLVDEPTLHAWFA